MFKVKPFFFLLLCCVVTFGIANAQVNMRPSTQVDTTTTGVAYGPSVSSDGELSAVAYNDNGQQQVFVVTSDGRGITWSAPIRVDQDPGGTTKKYTQEDSVTVLDGSIYVAWEDERYGTSSDDVFFNYSDDGGATWAGEFMIPKGFPTGSNSVRDWRMVVSPGVPDNNVYFLLSVDNGDEAIYLVYSHDGGANFTGPVAISDQPVHTVDVDYIDMAANSMIVHVAFIDDRNGSASYDDVWYQQSTDGGATWLPADVQLDASGLGVGDAEGGIEIAVVGNMVAVGWQEEYSDAANEEVQVNVSQDGGLTWNGAVMVGGYSTVTDDCDGSNVAISDYNGTPTVIAAWRDNRSGGDEIYTSTSMTYGATWNTDVVQSSQGGSYAKFPRLSEVPETTVLTWSSGDYPNRSQAAFTNDGGQTWTGDLEVSDNTGFDVDYAEVGFNTLYNNGIYAWLCDDLGSNNVYVGGFRAQNLTEQGNWTANGSVWFDASNWVGGNANFGVFIAGGTGNYVLPLGFGLNTGLANDAYLNVSKGYIMSGQLSGTLTAGAGSTPPLTLPGPGQLPPGLNLYCVAFGYDTGPASTGYTSDIVHIVTY